MSFILHKGKTRIAYFPKTASTALAADSLVALSSGYLIAATSSTAKHVGVLRKAVAATDSDYASTTLVPVEVPINDMVEWLATTSSAVAADVGNSVDLTDAVTVNRAATSHKVVTIVGIVSATVVRVVLNSVLSVTNGS